MRQQSSRAAFVEAVVLLLAVGLANFIIGYEIDLVLFYLVPILMAVYWCENWVACLMAVLCGAVWWGANAISGHHYTSSTVQVWDLSLHIAFFLLVGFGSVAVKSHSRMSKGRIDLLEHNRQLESQIVEISEHEQERIGQELHDGLCQYLAAIRCTAAALKTELDRANLQTFAAAADDVSQLLQSAVRQAHDLARGLVPVQLGEGGLTAALDELVCSSTRLLGVPCSFQPHGRIASGDEAKMRHLYRIAQEAINNAAKHARPNQISVALSSNANATILSVSDDGVGISKTRKNQHGLGLSIMKSRSAIIGGEFFVEEPSSGGTVISCSMHREAGNGVENGALVR